MSKYRTFFPMQYEKNLRTGETLITEDQIKLGLAHKSIKKWAYIRHDSDVYTEKDVAGEQDRLREEYDNLSDKGGLSAEEYIEINHHMNVGEIKPPHWHLVLKCDNGLELSQISRWFGIPENYIDVPKGAGAFLDCVQYLTHEELKQQQAGKRLYPDEDVRANFDFRTELAKRAENRAKYGRDLNVDEQMQYDVLYGGVTLRVAREQHPIEYMESVTTLERLRLRYISEIMPMPSERINFYIEGSGGIGKGLISRALARVLVDPDYNNPDSKLWDDEIFFEVGADNTSFEGYDGQPVIIWNDCRAYTLLKKLGGRENVFNVFDPYPARIKQNVKYSSVVLKNRINIVNSVQPWSEFLDGLAGEYETSSGQRQKAEDKSQSYRRFPMFLVLHEEDFDLGMNKGVFDGTREYTQYMMMQGLRGSMKKIVDRCGDNVELRNAASGQMLAPVKDKTVELEDKMSHHQRGTDEEIMAEFADYGTGGTLTTVDAHPEETMKNTPLPFADPSPEDYKRSLK